MSSSRNRYESEAIREHLVRNKRRPSSDSSFPNAQILSSFLFDTTSRPIITLTLKLGSRALLTDASISSPVTPPGFSTYSAEHRSVGRVRHMFCRSCTPKMRRASRLAFEYPPASLNVTKPGWRIETLGQFMGNMLGPFPDSHGIFRGLLLLPLPLPPTTATGCHERLLYLLGIPLEQTRHSWTYARGKGGKSLNLLPSGCITMRRVQLSVF